MNPTTLIKVAEIQRLLVEAYTLYFQVTDGHSKVSEGAVTLHFPTLFHATTADSIRVIKESPECAP